MDWRKNITILAGLVPAMAHFLIPVIRQQFIQRFIIGRTRMADQFKFAHSAKVAAAARCG